MDRCDISVLMSVYNTKEPWLREAIESILNQSYSNFEFIIVLDCPTDGSDAVVREYAQKDARIKVIQNETNIGLTCSLNKGLAVAQGRYIARMDADDIALPQRFEKQLAFMDAHPDVAAVGARVYTPGTDSTPQYECPQDQDVLKIRLLFHNAGLPHPTAFIRKSTLDAHGLTYTESVKKSQDYKLWTGLVHYGKILLLPEVLLMYRVHEGQISAGKTSQMGYAQAITKGQAEELLGTLTEKELEFHLTAMKEALPGEDARGYSAYLKKVSRANKEKHLYDQKKLDRELHYMWCQKAVRRAKLLRKFDMLLSPRTVRIFGLLPYIRENKTARLQYLEAIRAMDQ